MKRVAAIVALVTAFCVAVPVRAASPLAALPVGSSIAYTVTSQSNGKDGSQNSSHNLRFTHTTPTSIAVTVDGSPSGTIALSADGSVVVPPNLKAVLTPFGMVATFMRGAPKPLSAQASWTANLPVPVDSDTANVPVVLTVTQLGLGGATVRGGGNTSLAVQPRVREFPTDVSATTTLSFRPDKVLASASGSVSVTIHMGPRGRRDKQYGSSWTIAVSP